MDTQCTKSALLGRALSIALSCALWWAGAAVHAQEPDEYRETIAQALAEYDRGNWDEAYALFRRSHQLSPSARTWRGIGVVAFELRLYVECISALDAAVSDVRKPLTDEQRVAALELAQRARAFVATYNITLRSEGGARLLVDDRLVRLSGDTLLLNPGEHTLSVQLAARVEARHVLRAVAGTREDLTFELADATDSGSQGSGLPTEGRAETAAPSGRSRSGWPWTWSLSAAALAAGGVGAGLAVATQHQHESFQSCPASTSGSDCPSAAAKGLRLQRATNGTLASAGVLAGAAIVAFFLELPRHRDQKARATVVPTRHGLVLHGAF